MDLFKEVRLPNGYQAARKAPVAAVIAEARDGEIILLRHSRPVVNENFLEIPAGHIEKDETPEHAARREFQEETGLDVAIESKDLLFCGYTSPGFTDEKIWIYHGCATIFSDMYHVLNATAKPNVAFVALNQIYCSSIADAKTALAVAMLKLQRMGAR